MAHGAPYPDTGRLPAELPIFPLPKALLLPGGQLPLNIFEPRYISMTLDALGQGRLIGMIQPLPVAGEMPTDPDPRERPAVYPVGCAGRIISFSETGDGRLMITLLGQSRFRVTGELPLEKGYRRVTADYGAFAADLETGEEPAFDRARLLRAAGRYFQARGLNADTAALEKADGETLVTTLAMACPFEVREKQALLEAADTALRADLLTGLLDMAAHGEGGTNGAAH